MKIDTELKVIFNRIRNGDKTAFSDLFLNYRKLVFSVAMSIINNYDSANDITQNVFLKLYILDKDKFPASSELSWLYTVAKNESLVFMRRKPKEVSIEGYEEVPDQDVFQEVISKDTYYSLVKNLPQEQREIVTLKVLGGLTHKEIAAILKMPIGTVQWKYHKAVHKLRTAWSNLLLAVAAALVWTLAKDQQGDTIKSKEILQYLPAAIIVIALSVSVTFFVLHFITKKKNNDK